MDKEQQIRQMIIAELARMDENKIREIIRDELAYLIKTDKYVFSRKIVISDGRNIELGTTVGTQIGTTALQKLGFWGKTPIVQAGAIAATGAKSVTYVQGEAQATDTAVNAIRTALTNAGITA
jgi:hypothetical protein